MSLYEQVVAELDRHDPHRLLTLGKALRAVVELHPPVQISTYSAAGLPIQVWVCDHCASLCHSRSGLGCDEPRDGHYPCADIEAIARELGIEAGEGRGQA